MAGEDNTNLYQPDGDDTSGAERSSRGASVSWTASEFVEHKRGAGWYLLLIVITVVLAAGVYLVTKDYFAAGVIIVLGIILAFFVGQKPHEANYEVNGSGLKIGDKDFPYHNFKSFAVVRDGPLSSLAFYPLKRFSPPMSIYFDPKDEERITNIVGEHLPLDQRKTDRFDNLTRRLKI